MPIRNIEPSAGPPHDVLSYVGSNPDPQPQVASQEHI
jgi:hypothetical protein